MRTTRLLVALLALGACGDSAVPALVAGPGDDVGFTDLTDVAVVGGTTWLVPQGACIEMVDGRCMSADEIKKELCGDVNAQADIVVVDGKVVKVICYPPKGTGTPIEEATVNNEGQTQLPQNESGKVVTFPAASDGKPIKGDVRLDGERTTLIGNGIDKTIIEGNLTIASNNAKIRGLTVLGNVVFEKNSNGNSISFCKVKGNVVVHANDITVIACQIFGNLEVDGNGSFLLSNGVGGAIVVSGSGETCSGNFKIDDKNGNTIFDPGEKGAALSCAK
jgi:hypothetical protein